MLESLSREGEAPPSLREAEPQTVFTRDGRRTDRPAIP
jgi:hypothetical protein